MAAAPQILSSSDGASDPPAFLLAMETLEQIKVRAEAAMPGAKINIVSNPGPANQPSLLIDNEHASAVARFLRDDPALRLDFCSNATGVDWLDRAERGIPGAGNFRSLRGSFRRSSGPAPHFDVGRI